MNISFFHAKNYERQTFDQAFKSRGLTPLFLDCPLDSKTAHLAKGSQAVCLFVNDKADSTCLHVLKELGVKLIALRCSGFNNVDIEVAKELNIKVVRVPAYSPEAISEHALCLLLSLSRKIHKAHLRTLTTNFSLEGLMGFNISGKTVGVIGTGAIGLCFAKSLHGLGARVLAHDLSSANILKEVCSYTSFENLLKESDIISLHLPLNEQTHHLLDKRAFEKMKPGVVLINTSRGGLIDTKALIENLKNKKIRAAGLDVYEEEDKVFFKDFSNEILEDDDLARLLTFPNILITSHQGFLTEEAVEEIAQTTASNIDEFFRGDILKNSVF